jgi:succinate-acetate transporter protein
VIGSGHQILAVFLLRWLIWTVLLWVATFRVSLVPNLLFLDLIAVLAFLAAGLASVTPPWCTSAGTSASRCR